MYATSRSFCLCWTFLILNSLLVYLNLSKIYWNKNFTNGIAVTTWQKVLVFASFSVEGSQTYLLFIRSPPTPTLPGELGEETRTTQTCQSTAPCSGRSLDSIIWKTCLLVKPWVRFPSHKPLCACLACTNPWVQSLVPQRTNKRLRFYSLFLPFFPFSFLLFSILIYIALEYISLYCILHNPGRYYNRHIEFITIFIKEFYHSSKV